MLVLCNYDPFEIEFQSRLSLSLIFVCGQRASRLYFQNQEVRNDTSPLVN